MSTPSSWKTRRDALEGADVNALKKALSDSNRFVRSEAARRLGTNHIEEPGVLDALMKGLTDRSTRVREVALEFLPHFGAAAHPALESLLADANMLILYQAAQAVAKLAEAKPHIGQRNLANVLKKRARGWFMRPADRKVLRDCAERIEWAVYHLKDMPIAAGAPTTQADLPRPATEPAADPTNLPIPWWQAIFRRDR